ncbi:hypothetical protein AMECASPLE_009527 [Ameca splendens]|uniref:Uncharacterized protein n=1 Tax=Ameca splendens TaxID=208324 RepID=A0ABV0XPC8_9TELE
MIPVRGAQCNFSGWEDPEEFSQKERVPHTVYGSNHSSLLPVVLDAIWCCSHDGNIWPTQHHQPCRQRGTVTSGQEQHRHQPCHLHPDE